ncbi:hypothetical protein [Paenibacillus illinoisensis]|uniref:COG1470 family protein n=1 Tax=Paenibacillus illinoisensis TaxID=59845 RepID=UPI003D2B2806
MEKSLTQILLMEWERQDERGLGSITAENHIWKLYPGIPFTLQHPGVHLDNHWIKQGFVTSNTYSVDLRDWYALELEADFPLQEPIEMKVEIGLLRNNSPLPEEVEYVSAHSMLIAGEDGRVKFTLALRQFDDIAALTGKWKFVRSVRISAKWLESGASDPITIHDIRFVRRPAIYLETQVRSRPVAAGSTVKYDVVVHNCTDKIQPVVFSLDRYGWETMDVSIEPGRCVLQPRMSLAITVQVDVPERIAPGGYENQKLVAVPGGRGELAETLTLTTLRELSHPYIKHVESGWNEVRQNIRDHAWICQLKKMYEQRAEEWEVPENDSGHFLFQSYHAHEAENAVIVWKLTGRPEIAEKGVRFLRTVVNPDKGYPRKLQACHQELVHEGEFFKHTAVVYDLLADSSLLTAEDHANVEHSFRLFMDLMDYTLTTGDLSNWTIAQMVGALYCSQALQDLEQMNRFLFGVGGFADHLAKATLDDGWWYECSVGYNMMSAGLFTEVAQSCKPWGINLADSWLPAQYHDQITPGSKPDKDGLSLDIWGPRRNNYRSIRQLWDSLLPFADYRGVVFGVNDSAETKLLGISERGYLDARYDLAYYLYRQPEYGDIVLGCKLEERDLLYAVPGILPSESKSYLKSAYADTAGVVVLRSQTEGREPKDQIQAVVKYGIHGGAHGHYDRVSLLSVMRHGRSFYNPENIWYSYHTFMYKFYVQSSLTHNMVVVDRKQQNPTEGQRLLFHSGKVFQACAVENTAKWSYPPYGGWRVDGESSFSERAWNEGRYMPIPEVEPEYTKRTGFTEPILQRRLTVVTDDYIVLFDYMEGQRVHEYDCMFHCKGLVDLEGEGKRLKARTDQFDPDPLSGAQLITDCQWYSMEGAAKARFEMSFGLDDESLTNRTRFNEAGSLLMDHYTLWPPAPEIIVGNDPEVHRVDKQLFYQVRGDGRILQKGQFGAWILGRDDLDLNIEGVEILELRVRTKEGVGDNGFLKSSEKTIFWGDPYLETANGIKIYLADLSLATENSDPGYGIGKDYFGGPVKLAVKMYERAIPANPLNTDEEGIIRVSLKGLNAVRLITAIGGDYPLGDEAGRRKMLSTRSVGRTARFMTVIEPYESYPMIISAVAISEDEARIGLADGRIQTIRIQNIEDMTAPITVTVEESDLEGHLLRRETASGVTDGA